MVIVHTESSHGWGGQEIRILTESRELQRRGHQVTVLADPDSLIAQRAADYGVTVDCIRLKEKRIPELRSMIKAINRLNPDVIGTHSSTDHWIAAIARSFSSTRPAIVRTRHISAPIKHNLGSRWLYSSGCEFIVTTGNSIRIDLIDNGFVPAERVSSVPTGIDLQYFKSIGRNEARQRIRNKVGIDPNAFIFGNIATLRSWKGQDDLIRSFALITHELPHAQLLIVGDGPQAETLRLRVATLGLQQKVCFAGHQADVRDYFDALDIFVFPSYANEGIPQAILQAIAYGLPIITTSAGSIPEAIHGYPAARFVSTRDVKELSSAMLSAAKIAVSRGNIPTEILDRISISVMADHMEAVYLKMLPKAIPGNRHP